MIETEILSVLSEKLFTECGLFTRITNGSAPPGNGIFVRCSPITPNSDTTENAAGIMRVTFFVRHSSDKTAFETIFGIARFIRKTGYNTISKGLPPETFLMRLRESPSFHSGTPLESVYSAVADIYYSDAGETPSGPDVPDAAIVRPMLKFNGSQIPNVVSCAAVLRTRGAKLFANANGNMLIDLLPRKYRITARLENLSLAQLNEIYSLISENEFFNVTFLTPQGVKDGVFFMEEKPSAIDFFRDGQYYCNNIKLELEER